LSDDDARRSPAAAANAAPRSQMAAIGALLRDSLARLVRPPRLGRRGLWLLAGLALIGWASTSLYQVRPDEQGVVRRFGREIATVGPGWRLHLPFPVDIVAFSKAATSAPAAPAPHAPAPGSPS
jgi:hypothetical protein